MSKLTVTLLLTNVWLVSAPFTPSLLAQPSAERCSYAPTVLEVLRRADLLRDGNNYRSAVRNCYIPFYDTPMVSQAPVKIRERFLFDFADACLKAASSPELRYTMRSKYLWRSIEPSKQYINIDDFEQRQHRLSVATSENLAIVVSQVGASISALSAITRDHSLSTGDDPPQCEVQYKPREIPPQSVNCVYGPFKRPTQVLDWYEEVYLAHKDTFAHFFAYEPSITNWLDALLYDRDTFERFHINNLGQVRAKMLGKNSGEADSVTACDWWYFRAVMRTLITTPSVSRAAREQLQKIEPLNSTLDLYEKTCPH